MKKLMLIFFMLISTIVSCTEESDEVIVDDRDEQYRLYDYYIDPYGNEGIVCYADTSHTINGTIMIISVDESFLPWGPLGDAVCRDDSVTADMLANPSFGLSMLQSMTMKGIEQYPAMNWCASKNPIGIAPNSSSWRLPTRNELAAIFGDEKYANLKVHSDISILNETLNSVGGTPVQEDHYYWTCNEDYELDTLSGSDHRNDVAIPITISNHTFENKEYGLKKNKYYVRAIKYIYYKKGIL